MDAVFVVLGVVLWLLMVGMAQGCARLVGGSK